MSGPRTALDLTHVRNSLGPLTLNLQTGVVSTEDTGETWEVAKEEAMKKVRERANRPARADSPMADEAEVKKILLTQ